jgi:O-acetyl-ADP-ribose deacetylase (regulator of RNase III)
MHDVRIQHALNRNILNRRFHPRYPADRNDQGIAMMWTRLPDQCSVDIEQDKSLSRSCHFASHLHYYSDMKHMLPNGRELELMQGDITQVPADAIANAANSGLLGGGGVDGAIHRAAGAAIMRELDDIRDEQGGCPTGGAVVTSAGRLPAKYVFHAVGPVYSDGSRNEPDLLASAYRSCLALADEHRATSLSFPSISTGVYGYPVKEAAEIAVNTVLQYLSSEASTLKRVVFVLFDPRTLSAYEEALQAQAR